MMCAIVLFFLLSLLIFRTLCFWIVIVTIGLGCFFFLPFFLTFYHTVGCQKIAGFQEFVDSVSFNVCAFGCARSPYFSALLSIHNLRPLFVVKLSLSSICRSLCLSFPLHLFFLCLSPAVFGQPFSFVVNFSFLFLSHLDTSLSSQLNVTLCFL